MTRSLARASPAVAGGEMPIKPVKPVKVLHRGKTIYRVIVPIDLRPAGEKRQTKWYTSRADAEQYAEKLQAMRDEIGQRFLSLSKTDQAMLLKALEQAGTVQAVYDAVQFWKASRPATAISLKELVQQCSDAKERGGDTVTHCYNLRQAFNQFVGFHGNSAAHEVQPEHIERWIHEKREPEWSANTKANYLKYVRSVFAWALENRYVAKNPAAVVKKPKVDHDKPPAILTVAQAETLTRTAEATDRGLLRYLALCLFGGLRPSEAQRITAEEIKPDGVMVFARKVRMRGHRLVKNPTLDAWLSGEGELPPSNLRKRMRRIAKAAGIEWEQDVLRHSFVSYYYALHGEVATANQAGHSQSTLVKHYKALVTQSDAEKFWQILPIKATETA
jgi:integrase